MTSHQGELPAVGTDIYYYPHLAKVTQHGSMFHSCGHTVAPQYTAPRRHGQNTCELAAFGYQVCDDESSV